MFDGGVRKLAQVARDPELRHWLAGRLLGRWPGEPAFTPHRPPYLAHGLPLAGEAPDPPVPFPTHDAGRPEAPLHLSLPGGDIRVHPGDESALFRRSFNDPEILLALHRFAWVALQDPDPAWVAAIWRAWAGRFATPGEGWPWHPYTAAERAVNVLRFARAHGLPGRPRETLGLLAAHGPAIARRLEYFGDHHTSNHLANNGRGLFLLGLELGLGAAADLGGRILIEEAGRLFHETGVLREGSSHYHCVVTRNYVECWLAARAHGRPEEAALEAVAGRALAVIPALTLTAGMPLVGDISPDCPPPFLDGLRGSLSRGWTGLLAAGDTKALSDLREACEPADEDALAAAGWLRVRFGPWDGLWHAAPAGWSPMPGHGHQDCGAFELHFGSERVFVDPGRGAYGETGEAALYRSGAVHNTLLVDGHDPYPPNRPYYDDAFRMSVGGPPPALSSQGDGVTLGHSGFRRLGNVGAVRRRWRFAEKSMTLTDEIAGRGCHLVTRLLAMPLDGEAGAGGVALTGGGQTFHLRSTDGETRIEPLTLWRAYGKGRPGHLIRIDVETTLPWTGEVRLEVV